MSSAQMAVVITPARPMAQRGIRYHHVSSMRRPRREVLRTVHLSMLGPSMPNSEGSTVTDRSAARPTAEMEP